MYIKSIISSTLQPNITYFIPSLDLISNWYYTGLLSRTVWEPMIAVIVSVLEASVPGFHLFQIFNFLHGYLIQIHLSHVVLSTHHHSLYQYSYVNLGDSQTSQIQVDVPEQFGQVCILHTHSEYFIINFVIVSYSKPEKMVLPCIHH